MKSVAESVEGTTLCSPPRFTAPHGGKWCCPWMIIALLLISNQARAAFHLWTISEIYSSADRSVQFVEFSTAFSGQTVVGGRTVTAFNSNSSLSVVFTIPSNFGSDTANRRFLIATPGFGSIQGSVTPDFVFTTTPFLFLGSGSLSFSGGDSVTYANLPTDGRGSLVRSGGSMVFSAANSPQNYLGQTGSVPEPGVLAILASGALTVALGLRGRRRRG